MSKKNLIEEEARTAILAGMDLVADIVGATLGPRGKTVILSRPYGAALVTKDGVTVAERVSLNDPCANEGAKLIQEVARKTNTEAGDGTTAATILCRAIFREGVKVVAAGANSMAIERGIQRAVACVVERLAEISQPIDQQNIDSIRAIATIAANGDTEMGDVISRAVQRTGLEGVCMVDMSPTIETTLEISEGLQFDRGFLSPHFMTDRARGVTILENCNIFVTDRRLIAMDQAGEFITKYLSLYGNAPLLLIAEDVAEGALQVLAVNNGKTLNIGGRAIQCTIVPVRAPGSGAAKKEELEDIAILTGARAYNIANGDDLTAIKQEDFGSATRVIVSPHRTTIVGGFGAPIRIETRKDEIRSRIADPITKEFDKAQLERRLALLSASIAVIKIGSSVNSKLLEKRDRVEDSVNATKAALKEGIVPGGGVALIRCLPALNDMLVTMDGEEQVGARIVAQALTRPLHRLASNAGVSGDVIVGEVVAMNSPETYIPAHFDDSIPAFLDHWGYNAASGNFEDMIAAGIIDPAKVVRLALQNSAELAGLLLTSAALVVDIPEPVSAVAAPPRG